MLSGQSDKRNIYSHIIEKNWLVKQWYMPDFMIQYQIWFCLMKANLLW